MGVAPSLRDIVSDFLFAGKMERYDDKRYETAIFSYFFIGLPGTMLFMTGIQKSLTNLGLKYFPTKMKSSVGCRIFPSIVLCILVISSRLLMLADSYKLDANLR